MKKIAIFKPYNARLNNAFGSGQYPVFKRFKELGYEVVFFLDDRDVKFEGVENRYVKVKPIQNFILKVVRRVLNVQYIKIPYYGNIDFNEFDIVITEGLHYPFLSYFDKYEGLLIINDSITAEERIKRLNSKLINKKFASRHMVCVNKKMYLLHQKYNIHLPHSIIGHALDVDKIKFYQREKFNGKIVSIGRLVYEKGYIYIFKALEKLIKKYPYITLDIYGDGPLKTKLEQNIKEMSLENNIFLKGSLKYDNLMKSLKEYDLFISHPLEVEHIAEAFHMGNMEAMANGIPVITSDCGGVPYVVKDRAIICKQKYVEDIENAIENFIQNENLFPMMSLKGRKFVEDNYSIEIIFEKWKKLIESKSNL